MTDLSPCPACGSARVRLMYEPPAEGDHIETCPGDAPGAPECTGCGGGFPGQVFCEDCQMHGPFDDPDASKYNAMCAALSGGWVRCSERMPEADMNVRVTLEAADGTRACWSGQWLNGRGWLYDGPVWTVIAWREDEPYRGPA